MFRLVAISSTAATIKKISKENCSTPCKIELMRVYVTLLLLPPSLALLLRELVTRK